MTETQGTTSSGGPVFPPGRYGRRRADRPRRRWLPALLAAVVVVAAAGLAVKLYAQYGAADYDPRLLRFTDVTDSQVVIEFTVRVPPGETARCTVRARSEDGAEVGLESVTVPAPGDLVRHRLATTARPVTGEVVRCHPAD